MRYINLVKFTAFVFICSFICLVGANVARANFEDFVASGERCTVTLYATDKNGEFTSFSVPKGCILHMPCNYFENSGKSFVGWNTKNTGVGIFYNVGDEFVIKSNMTFYAMWEERAVASIIEIAKSQLDRTGETYTAWFGYDGMWCNMFLSWCFEQVNDSIGDYNEVLKLRAELTDEAVDNSLLVNQVSYIKSAYCPTSEEWYKSTGRWLAEGARPAAGMVIFFHKSTRNGAVCSDHIGLVTAVNGDTVTTIEGNSGGKVSERTYTIGEAQIIGYGVPDYLKGYLTVYGHVDWTKVVIDDTVPIGGEIVEMSPASIPDSSAAEGSSEGTALQESSTSYFDPTATAPAEETETSAAESTAEAESTEQTQGGIPTVPADSEESAYNSNEKYAG